MRLLGTLVALIVVNMTPANALCDAALVRLEMFAHGELVYVLTFDRIGKISVEIFHGDGEQVSSIERSDAKVSPLLFDSLCSLLLESGSSSSHSLSVRREVDFELALLSTSEEVVMALDIGGFDPNLRQLMLSMFATLHHYASDTKVEFFSRGDHTVGCDFCCKVSKGHLEFIGLLLAVQIAGLGLIWLRLSRSQLRRQQRSQLSDHR